MEIKGTQNLGKRTCMALAGMVLTGFGVGGLQKASLGVDPFTSLVTGIGNIFHLSYGTLYPIITAILLTLVVIFNRKLIGISTVLNLVVGSWAADTMKGILNQWIPDLTVPVRFIILFITLIVICFAASLYYIADLGVAAYDGVALTLSGKYKICSFKVCRVCCDLVCCFTGFVFHANLGIGTIITAFMMGPVIQWFNTNVTEKYIYRKEI